MEICEFLSKCAYYQKYKYSSDMSHKSLISIYCKGEDLEQCMRRQQLIKKKQQPAEDMMPSGSILYR